MSSDESDEERIHQHFRVAGGLLMEAARIIIHNEIIEPSTKRTRGPHKNRDREEGHDKLFADYFSDNPVYNDNDFSRRFRMTRRLFQRIVGDLENEFDFFKQQWDARGVKGFSPIQKCTSAIRQLAYRTVADSTDEYLRMSETTSRECLSQFCKGIIRLYMRQYLRNPTASDTQAIYALHENVHGLPGMLGSMDFALYDQWIWHAFFGVPGATNDIIVVNQSPVFNDIFDDKAPDSSFVVNGTQYKHGYYLVDGIYPEWLTFVKAFSWPSDNKWMEFKTRQESARKDIERTFTTLKDKWHVVKYPARVWSRRKLKEIMYTCIILHNMIREDEGWHHSGWPKNIMFHKRTKHIDVRYHWIRDALEDKMFELDKVHTDDNGSDSGAHGG
ncbi:hypothetical protein OSB04_002856 [Centaurea solstitialis]|uniref:Uncharacterized protein n=1 Tax=Centaurea solstitialis TaxID=347529 RepID=A0AA38U5G2_9ASTR|nr:hypothetical protein OSB04_002856 [Centaurea solstitialis]